MDNWQKLCVFSCIGMFFYLYDTGMLHAAQVTQWNRLGSGEIINGTVEYERE